MNISGLCQHLHPVACFVGILIVSFVALRLQDWMVTTEIRKRDPALFEYMKGAGYDTDVTGLYGWWIAARFLRGIWGRQDLIVYFRRLYHLYLAAAAGTIILMILMILIAFIHDDYCVK